MENHIAERKKQLRREVRELAAGLPAEYCKTADRQILCHIVNLTEYQRADTIFCFVGTEHEIDTVPVLMDAWKQGKRVCVPKCAGKGLMNAYRISGMDDLQDGSYGILEPSETADRVLPEEIGLVLVPCLSNSADGKRLGYGGGYYDRYLVHVTAPKAVLCRKWVMRDDIPEDIHDLRMDMVICEDGVLR